MMSWIMDTVKVSVADPDPFDMDPNSSFHVDADPDPAFHFDPDPTVFGMDPDPYSFK
jgi:hypothetical protein